MISPKDLIMPYFIIPGTGKREEVSSMPGIFRFSSDLVLKEIKGLKKLGITKILLFGIPKKKYQGGDEAYDENGTIQEAVKLIKKENKDITVIADVCLCAYTTHGHCRMLAKSRTFDDNATLEILAKIALSHARAGAEIVAPSAVLKHQVQAIRKALDSEGFRKVKIMSYSAKFASSFYWPFRDALDSAPKFGKRSYQLDMADMKEAFQRIAQDIKEGADIVMVKPSLAYLDIIRAVKEKFNFPLAVYNVSGEYSMVKAASLNGWLDEKKAVLEILTAIKRSGADVIITYHAKEIAKTL